MGIVCLAILAYFLFSFSGLVVNKQRLETRYQGLQQEVTALKAESAELEKEAAYLQTDQALETLARENLGWVKPGETGIVTEAPEQTALAQASTTANSNVNLRLSHKANWERWWAYIFGD
jgi:cell division protein FtsB